MNAKKTSGEPRAAFNERVGAQSSLGRAVSLHLEGRLKEALRELDQALERGESSSEIHSARGHIQFELELFEDAANSYTKLLELDPHHPTATFNLAVCLEKMGRWSQAGECFQRAYESDPNRIDALVGLGVCLLHLDRAQTSLDSFDKVLAIDAAQETALFGRGVALQLTGRLDEASEVYRGILETDPSAEDPMVNLIGIGIARKDYE
jgi:tetratricopeptide (TPR) repeat protein